MKCPVTTDVFALLKQHFLLSIIYHSSCVSHHTWDLKYDGALSGQEFAARPGVVASFEHPAYSNGYFLGFEGWMDLNKRYGATNITYIVRIEFDRRSGFRERRIQKHFRRFWLPGAIWVERNIRSYHKHRSNLTLVRTRNVSHVDLWVKPKCFLRHHGVSRIYRVAKTLKVDIEQLRWVAKVTYAAEESYGTRELMEIAKAMTAVSGVQCAWLHPDVQSSFGLMLRFYPGAIPAQRFFSPTAGYNNWAYLNDEYQVSSVSFVRGWSRALLRFRGGLVCRQGRRRVAEQYQALPGVRFVYLDGGSNGGGVRGGGCRFTYQIVLAFDKRVVDEASAKAYGHWNGLNHLYGVVNVVHSDDLKTILEFEPGLYSHVQMKAIRDEYLKLPGIRFGWVTGRRARDVTTIVLNFSPNYLRRVPMRYYNAWDTLNRRYSTNITILEESKHRAYVRFPEGRYTDLELKAILRKYRQLPGVTSVRMDVQIFAEKDTSPTAGAALNATVALALPPPRTLRSWMKLSNADGSHFGAEKEDGDEAKSPFARDDRKATCVSN